MNKYEVMFIIDPALEDEKKDATIEEKQTVKPETEETNEEEPTEQAEEKEDAE